MCCAQSGIFEEEHQLSQADFIPCSICVCVCDPILHLQSRCESVHSNPTLQIQPVIFWQEETDLTLLLVHRIFEVTA